MIEPHRRNPGDWDSKVNRPGLRSPSDIDLRDRATRDAMKAIARDIPDPDEYARQLPPWAAEALVQAARTPSDGWCVPAHLARMLRPLGLAGYGTNGLTAFGWRVRQIIVGADA